MPGIEVSQEGGLGDPKIPKPLKDAQAPVRAVATNLLSSLHTLQTLSCFLQVTLTRPQCRSHLCSFLPMVRWEIQSQKRARVRPKVPRAAAPASRRTRTTLTFCGVGPACLELFRGRQPAPA
jgi:hypothetical protein